ncbi:hypothetical protein [Brachybacterium sp. GCM10030252]|uniref:hypothetical protein n=1 Tax=Brachybacterium sp. GCM10030252 TaxID=3273380 RepID=UPI003618B0E6
MSSTPLRLPVSASWDDHVHDDRSPRRGRPVRALGFVLVVVAAVLLVSSMASIYATTMTVRRSTLSPWAVVLGAAAVTVGALGGVLVLL